MIWQQVSGLGAGIRLPPVKLGQGSPWQGYGKGCSIGKVRLG